ncbi:MAG: hypothetical protein IJR77_02260 [Bacteroidales bacterium]|nr:hypothetical protein [Bacteroidales bacterium]
MKYIVNEHVYVVFRGQLCNAVILAARMREKLVGPAEALYMVRIDCPGRNGQPKEILECEIEDSALFRHPLWTDEKEVTVQIKELAKVRAGKSSDRETQVRTLEERISGSLKNIKRYGFVDNTTCEKLEDLFAQAKQILPADDSYDNQKRNSGKYNKRSIKTHKSYANNRTQRYPAQRFVHARFFYQKRAINWRVGNNHVNQRVRVSVPKQLRHLTRGR